MRIMDDKPNHPSGAPRVVRDVSGAPTAQPSRYPKLVKVKVAYEVQTYVHQCSGCGAQENCEVQLKLREDADGEFIEEDLVIQPRPPGWVAAGSPDAELCKKCQAKVASVLPNFKLSG